MGYQIVSKIRIPGLRAYITHTQRLGNNLLIQGSLFGPSWPSVCAFLEQKQIQYTLIEAGSVWLAVLDSPQNRQELLELEASAKLSRRTQVLLPGSGFVESGMIKKFETRTLLVPAITTLGIVLFSGLFLGSQSSPSVDPITKTSCALDLSRNEFNIWLQENLSSSSAKTNQVVLQTELGLINLTVDQSIGSTRSFTGYIQCNDGRSKPLSFRADNSSLGSIVELGEKLDS